MKTRKIHALIVSDGTHLTRLYFDKAMGNAEFIKSQLALSKKYHLVGECILNGCVGDATRDAVAERQLNEAETRRAQDIICEEV